ncbi:DUF4160 domain-containing protein [Skermanella mucosa]|uniref:DUF4160 domain-containing protein n=1 Tax=Skermanella mucosa TaxID=1789672 RepID=UPI00192BA15A|nr:DUF4160 domain-containing protein [Skermanella mucosa]UEM18419.1 DUF4160 domain-containing protein [Skermanella mucosa]
MFWTLEMRMGQVGNVVIRVYPDDTKKHRRPHFHAVGPDDNIVVGLPLLDIIEGSIASKDRDRVLDWATENLQRLIDAWNIGNPTIPVRTP